MSKVKWSGLRLGVALGGLSGLLWTGTENRLAWAQSTIFFSPALSLYHPNVEAENAYSKPHTPGPSPLSWAESLLTSKEAVDMVCKKIERSNDDRKSETLRAACLLPDGKRTIVEAGSNSCLRLRVAAEDSQTAILLCEGLLSYLNFKTKIALEDPARDQLTTTERQLRIAEQNLSKSLWETSSYLAGSSPAVSPQELELELGDYQILVTQYQHLMEQNFSRETRTAASNPFFTVIEPPYRWNPTSSWGRNFLVGILTGAFLGLLSDLIRRGQARTRIRRNLHWRAQEGTGARRTGSIDG